MKKIIIGVVIWIAAVILSFFMSIKFLTLALHHQFYSETLLFSIFIMLALFSFVSFLGLVSNLVSIVYKFFSEL